MNKNKLGIYITAQGFSGIEQWNPMIAVTMNLQREFLTALKVRGIFTVGRIYFDDQRIDGGYWADFMLPRLHGLDQLLDCVMAINEPAIWNETDAVLLRDATRIWSQRMHVAGFKTAAYSFPEGHPDLSLLPFLVDHGCDFYSRHEYDAPEMWRTQTWRCLRYRRERDFFPQPFIITEMGIDGGVAGVDRPQVGWKGFGDAAHYAESLRWYRDQIAQDDYVVGTAIFAGNWNIGNGSFNIENEETIRRVVNEVILAPPAPPIPPVPPVSPVAGWCPFATSRPVRNFEVGRAGHAVKAIVLHVADGEGSLYNLFNSANKVSSHFWISKAGEIEQYVSITDTAWANGLRYSNGRWLNPRGKPVTPAWNGLVVGVNPNYQTISIEHEGTPTDSWTPVMATANGRLINWLHFQIGRVRVPYETIITHSMLDPVDRVNDPGTLIEQGVMKMPLTEKPDARAPWITIERYAGAEPYWKLTEFQYLPAGQSDGTCNFYVVGWKDQRPAIGAVARLLWPDGAVVAVLERKEIPPDNRIQAGTDFYLNAMFDPNKVEEGPYRIQMTGNSDIVRGMGLPMNRHDGWFGAWEWIATLPAATLVDAVWARARSVPWMPVNHDAMLWKKAQRLKTEDQQTDELAFVYEGEDYLVQVFNLGILYAKKSEAGDPDKIQIIRK